MSFPSMSNEVKSRWTALITGQMPIPTSPPHYHLLAKSTSRIQYGVDHSAYMSTLAKDFGGAPGLYELWREHGLKVLFTYAFGASFVTVRNNLFMTKISINNVIVLSLARSFQIRCCA